MNATDLVHLIGSSSGPGWGTVFALAIYLVRLAYHVGQLRQVVRAAAGCPSKVCPVRAQAAALPNLPSIPTLTKSDH